MAATCSICHLLIPASISLSAGVTLLPVHRYVYTGGVLVKTPEWVRGGTYEEGTGVLPHSLGQ